MNIPREFINQLLEKIDIVDLINNQIPLQKKSGDNYFARCPFHQEKSASFSVSQTKQFYYCFGCGAHGNAIDFLMQQDRLHFVDAVETLAHLAGMRIPQSKQTAESKSLPILYDLLTETALFYHKNLKTSDRAIQYIKSRGMTGETAKTFQLGYASANHGIHSHFGKTKSDRDRLLEMGLLIAHQGQYFDRFRDRIIFPIQDYRGRVIGFGGRIIDQGEPKYLNSPETVLFQKSHALYGLNQVLKSNRKLARVLVVEGYMDVLALFQQGITYAVATLGTATSAHHLTRLFRYTQEIIFAFDGDQAGRTAAWRALQIALSMLEDGWQVRFLFLPEGEDPDSLVNKIGRPAFEAKLAKAMPLSQFFFDTLSRQCDLTTLEGRSRLASLALESLHEMPSNLLKNLILTELSERTRIELATLKQRIKSKDTSQKDPTPSPQVQMPMPIQLAIYYLLFMPELAKVIANFHSEIPDNALPGLTILNQIIDIIKENELTTTSSLIEYFRNSPESLSINQILQLKKPILDVGADAEFVGVIRQITLLYYETIIEQLLSKGAGASLTKEEKLLLSDKIKLKQSLINHPP